MHALFASTLQIPPDPVAVAETVGVVIVKSADEQRCRKAKMIGSKPGVKASADMPAQLASSAGQAYRALSICWVQSQGVGLRPASGQLSMMSHCGCGMVGHCDQVRAPD